MSFVLLKQLVVNEGQRTEMLDAKALQAACRAVKSDKPEVSSQQHILATHTRKQQLHIHPSGCGLMHNAGGMLACVLCSLASSQVSGSASELLGALVHYVTDEQIKALSQHAHTVYPLKLSTLVSGSSLTRSLVLSLRVVWCGLVFRCG